jgi:DNA-binding IclR family transcriptional regulator
MTRAAQRRNGTQSIERAIQVLKVLVERGGVGWRLLDLAEHCGLEHATTHRILAALLRERLAEQRPDRRYVAGPLAFELGVSMRAYTGFQAACRQPLASLARKLGGVAIVCERSDTHFVCIAREGRHVNAMTTSVSGVAILAAMPPAVARPIIAENFGQIGRFGESRISALRTMIRRSLATGYGISQGHVVPGIGAVGMAIRDSGGAPFASVAIVGTAENFVAERIPLIVGALGAAAANLERQARAEFGHRA